MIPLTHKHTASFIIFLLFFLYHFWFAQVENGQLIQFDHVQESNFSRDTHGMDFEKGFSEIDSMKHSDEMERELENEGNESQVEKKVSDANTNETYFIRSGKEEQVEEEQEIETKDDLKQENRGEDDDLKPEDLKQENEEKEEDDLKQENEEKEQKEENSQSFSLIDLYPKFSSHITEGFNHKHCHQEAPIFTFDFNVQQTVFSQELITQELVFQNKTLGESFNCSIGFVLYFTGEDELRNQIEGHGIINCNPNTKTYLANFVLPIPGFYKIKIETHYSGCRAFQPETSITSEFNITALPPKFDVSSSKCTQEDLENARFGYWYSQDSCQLPHCTGKLVKKKWMEANEYWSPFHCHLHFNSPEAIIEKLRGKTIMFLGDSTIEELIESLLLSMGFNEEVCFRYMKDTVTYTDKKEDFIVYNHNTHRLMTVTSPKYNITFLHRYTGHVIFEQNNMGAPTYWRREVQSWIHTQFRSTTIDLIIFNSGLHDQTSRYILRDDYLDRIKTLVSLMKNISETYQTKLLWKTSNPSNNLYRSQFFNNLATKVVQENQIPIVEIGGPCFSRINSIRWIIRY